MKARLPKGYGPQNMNQMMKQAQKVQEEMSRIQQEVEETEFEVATGGGMISLSINGKKEITKLEIAPEVVDPDDIEMLQDLLIAAFNEGVRRVEDETNTRVQAVTGGMNLPGFNL
ncbi:YbaB/EbfC family nucleoid-associated protein [Neobittarella massiliensis]|uniref:Nucleoid-associated protein H8K20_06965 n=3 Tax=Oscillospiraceae TaxID=216572 RepID=A0A8J6ILZ2_9FIRM|nr:YbaB/EbfC family nucleoid-associated protein [Neobittarella massiliensis]MBC3516134.1 YbaB/EbfC family nucleoid-associated protein [Neobittarella massiliensis]SCJ34261.1 DNA-binding protein%2C YbaB/EbfC family [uncultured Anaerotruncus sp.]